MTCYIFIYLNRDMVRGGRSRRVSTSVGRGPASPSTLGLPPRPRRSSRRQGQPPQTMQVAPPFPSSSPPDEEGPHLPRRQPCWISGGKIDPGSASRYITTLVHAHIPGPVDAWREFLVPVQDLLFDMFTRRYAFMRPEDLPRARAVWKSTTQTNLRKSMYEARDKAMKTTDSRDPMAWLDYGPVWLRRDYWESLCHRWAIGPWQERSQVAKRNRSTHPEKNVHTSGSVSYAAHSQKLRHELERVHTFCELFDRTHKRKGTNDHVSESARTITETYDRTMADRYVEGTPKPDLDLEAWVDAAGGLRKGRVYGFGDSLDTTPVLSSYASSVAPLAYASSSTAPPGSGVEEMRTLIREELRTHFGVMVEQLILAMQGVHPSQPAPQVSQNSLLLFRRKGHVDGQCQKKRVPEGSCEVMVGDKGLLSFTMGPPFSYGGGSIERDTQGEKEEAALEGE
ncbi:hypothetical protein Taro_006350 [Colocasia esculenta]|uniref:Transposase n=1 Tax=Colocasia esculenta TaxID=4460 RepID=A0A843TV22_COLES|nr:hypothetical protein [Colocasia esculenta]